MRRAGPILALLIGAAALGLLLQGEPGAANRPGPPGPALAPAASNPAVALEPGATRQPGDVAREPAAPRTGAGLELPAGGLAVGPHVVALADRADAPSLGPVRGLVRDARNHQPLVGAWLTWRAPDAESLARVFEEPEFRELVGHGAFGMLSDAEGRFTVDRLADELPPEPLLYAAAPGYAQGVVRAGLGADLVIDLEPGGTLRLIGARTLGGVGPRLTFAGDDPAYQAYLDRLLPAEAGGALEFPRLRPGQYAVTQGARAAEATLEVGRTTELVWPAPESIHVAGVLRGTDLDVRGWLEAERLDGDGGGALRLDDGGAFAGDLPAGTYALRWVDFASGNEWSLARVEGGVSGLELALPTSEAPLELRIEGVLADAVGLAEVAPGGSRFSAVPGPDGWLQIPGPAGRYHVFLPEVYLGQVELAPGQRPTLTHAPRDCVVRLRLPPLPEGQALRAQVRLVPCALDPDPALVRRLGSDDPQTRPPPRLLRGAVAELRLPVGEPGRYRLIVESDLGRAETTVELEPGAGPVELDLRAARR